MWIWLRKWFIYFKDSSHSFWQFYTLNCFAFSWSFSSFKIKMHCSFQGFFCSVCDTVSSLSIFFTHLSDPTSALIAVELQTPERTFQPWYAAPLLLSSRFILSFNFLIYLLLCFPPVWWMTLSLWAFIKAQLSTGWPHKGEQEDRKRSIRDIENKLAVGRWTKWADLVTNLTCQSMLKCKDRPGS